MGNAQPSSKLLRFTRWQFLFAKANGTEFHSSGLPSTPKGEQLEEC
jgi:hypothetical protein